MLQTEQLAAILPVNLEAERSILGAVLLDNFCFHQAAANLTAEDFSLDAHRRIWAAIQALADGGRAVDFITLAEELARVRALDAVGGVVYLSSLTDGLPRSQNIAHYVDIVRDKAKLRAIIHMANRARAAAEDQQTPADEVLGEVQQAVIEIVYHEHQQAVELRDVGRETIAQMTRLRSSARDCIGIPTGLDELNELTTGYREKEFYVIGARPGNGKTALMCQGARAAIQAGHKPGILSIEVPSGQIITRLACMETGVSVFEARDPRGMDLSKYNQLTEAIADISMSWPLFLDDARMTLKRMQAVTRLWVSKGCDVLYVDYLQKLAGRAPGKTDFERVTATADALWDLARFTRVPVVALSQLKRKQDEAEEPTMDDLRQSGEIEQNANGIFLIFRPKGDVEIRPGQIVSTWTGEDKLIIAKQRSGPAGMHVPVRFNGPVGMFEPRNN